MKALISSFLSFSRMERLSVAVLCAVLLLYYLGRFTMAMWVHPPADDAKQQRLNEAYLAWKAKEDLASPTTGHAEAPDAAIETSLFPFDPNTLDSVGFLRLGMPQRAVKGLMNWRRKGKRIWCATSFLKAPNQRSGTPTA